MPEIGLFGSEGGAPTPGVPTLSTGGEPGLFDYPFHPIIPRLSAVSKASRLTSRVQTRFKPWAEFSNPFDFGATNRLKDPLS